MKNRPSPPQQKVKFKWLKFSFKIFFFLTWIIFFFTLFVHFYLYVYVFVCFHLCVCVFYVRVCAWMFFLDWVQFWFPTFNHFFYSIYFFTKIWKWKPADKEYFFIILGKIVWLWFPLKIFILNPNRKRRLLGIPVFNFNLWFFLTKIKMFLSYSKIKLFFIFFFFVIF